MGRPRSRICRRGLWESISNNKYEQDHGEALYRRSLYTFWRRTIPPPLLTTLNAADREACVVRKDRTNTPLQALTLMNNVAFVEASRFLAERMLREGGDEPREQIRYGFMLATARPPSAEELSVIADAHRVVPGSAFSRTRRAPGACWPRAKGRATHRWMPPQHAAMTHDGIAAC